MKFFRSIDFLKPVFEFLSTYPFIGLIIKLILVLLLTWVIFILSRRYILKLLEFAVKKSKNNWDDMLVKRKVLNRLIYIIPALVFYHFAYLFPTVESLVKKLSTSYIILIILITINAFLNAINDIYETFEISTEKPIKGIIQTAGIVVYLVGFIIIAATIMNKSPALLLSGIGAMTAVLMLVFKDTLLSFVAGLQMSYNNTIRKGDWISMPKYNADGTVIDIALHNLTIQNWDKTTTTIPTHKFLEESFTNWRGMQESGGRRICRSINIDITSVKFLNKEETEHYKSVELLKIYIDQKTKEVDLYNKEKNIDLSNLVNGRRLTNIGTFRAYVEHYLKNHSHIRQDMTLLVRQLEPTDRGIPIQIYVFTNTTAWIDYEAIQADIFDHLMAIIPAFKLRVFQTPTGHDLSHLVKE